MEEGARPVQEQRAGSDGCEVIFASAFENVDSSSAFELNPFELILRVRCTNFLTLGFSVCICTAYLSSTYGHVFYHVIGLLATSFRSSCRSYGDAFQIFLRYLSFRS